MPANKQRKKTRQNITSDTGASESLTSGFELINTKAITALLPSGAQVKPVDKKQAQPTDIVADAVDLATGTVQTIDFFEDCKRVGGYVSICRTVRALRGSCATADEIVDSLNRIMQPFTKNVLTVQTLVGAVLSGSYTELGAAYWSGREEQLAAIDDYMTNYISSNFNKPDAYQAANNILAYRKQLKEEVEFTKGLSSVTVNATGQAVANLMAALSNVAEPEDKPDDDLDYPGPQG